MKIDYKKHESTHYDKSVYKIEDYSKYYHVYLKSLEVSVLRKSHYFWKSEVEKKMIKINEGMVLDYGCGTGIRSLDFKKNRMKLIGIDLSQRSVHIAKELSIRENVSANYFVTDCERMSFKDNMFDIIIDYGTFSSLNMEEALPEILRVLKCDGIIISIETLGHNPIMNLKRRLNVSRGKRTKWAANHIMKINDWKRIKKNFSDFEIHYFALLTPYLIFFINILPNLLKNYFIFFMECLDQSLLKINFLQKYAFKTVVVASKPLK